jgi:Leucine-rich repeat (LRR) protein
MILLPKCTYGQEIKKPDPEIAKRIEAIEKIKSLMSDTKLTKLILNEDPVNPYIIHFHYFRGSRTEDILPQLQLFPNIRSLDLTGSKISLKAAEHIQHMTNLVSLQLAQTSFDDEKMKYIKDLENLEALWLNGNNITSKGLEEIKNLKKIKRLTLYRTSISDEGLKYLSELQELEDLWLQYTKISDKGLVYLQGLKKLTFLHLSGTAVTIEGLLQIKGIPGLMILELGNTEYAKIKDSVKRKEIDDKLKKNFLKLAIIDGSDTLNKPLIDLPPRG